MKTKDFIVSANQRALHVLRNGEKNPEKLLPKNRCRNLLRQIFVQTLFSFRSNFCWKNGKELGNDSNYMQFKEKWTPVNYSLLFLHNPA